MVTRELKRPVSLFVLCVFLWGSISQVCYADQPSIEEILKKVAETYQSLQTYQFVAERIVKVTNVISTGRYGGSLSDSRVQTPTINSAITLTVGNRGEFRLEVKEEA